MSARIDRFLRMATVGVRPDRRSSAVCGGPFFTITPKSRDFGPTTPQSSTVVAHHEPGRAGWREGH